MFLGAHYSQAPWDLRFKKKKKKVRCCTLHPIQLRGKNLGGNIRTL